MEMNGWRQGGGLHWCPCSRPHRMKCCTRPVRHLASRYGFILLANCAASTAGLGERRRCVCENQMRQGQQSNSKRRASSHTAPRTLWRHRTGQIGVLEGPVDVRLGSIADITGCNAACLGLPRAASCRRTRRRISQWSTNACSCATRLPTRRAQIRRGLPSGTSALAPSAASGLNHCGQAASATR
jgi:hypothetical protein